MDRYQKILIFLLLIFTSIHSQTTHQLDSIARSNFKKHIQFQSSQNNLYWTIFLNDRLKVTASTRLNPDGVLELNNGRIPDLVNIGVYDIRMRFTVNSNIRITQRCLIVNQDQTLFLTGLVWRW